MDLGVLCASLACDPVSGSHAMTRRHLALVLSARDHHLLEFDFQLGAKDTKAARPRMRSTDIGLNKTFTETEGGF